MTVMTGAQRKECAGCSDDGVDGVLNAGAADDDGRPH